MHFDPSKKLFSSRTSVLVFAGLLSLFAPAALSAAESGAEGVAAGHLLRQGVVIDSPRATVYLMEPDGAVAALDIFSGNRLWAGPVHGEPLGLQGGRLLVLAEPSAPRQAEVVFLGLGTGGVEATVRFELPAGASVLLDDLPHRRFTAATALVGDDVFLHWTYSGRPLRGALLEGADAEIVEIAGVVRLDPATGTAQPAQGLNLPTPAPFIPDLSESERLPQLDGRQFRSVDDRVVLASRKTADAGTWDRYRWTFVEQSTGTRLGDLQRPNSMASFVVVGTTLVHVAQPYARRLPSGDIAAEALRLEVFDLPSGSQLWTADVRDTAFRGVLPP